MANQINDAFRYSNYYHDILYAKEHVSATFMNTQIKAHMNRAINLFCVTMSSNVPQYL